METSAEEVALLIAQTGPLNGQSWALNATLLVGREPGCSVIIPDRQVSRHHARFSVTPEGVLLEDLGSKNGTHLNGVAIHQPRLLEDGDVIQVAVVQSFVFVSSDATLPLERGGLPGVADTLPGVLSPLTPTIESLPPEPSAARTERLRLDKRSRRVWVRLRQSDGNLLDKEILPPLSVSQFRLLEILYDNRERVVSRIELAAAVWGEGQSFEISEQALDALVRRLRDRIGGIDPAHEYIVTIRGHGLRLDNPLI